MARPRWRRTSRTSLTCWRPTSRAEPANQHDLNQLLPAGSQSPEFRGTATTASTTADLRERIPELETACADSSFTPRSCAAQLDYQSGDDLNVIRDPVTDR